VADCGRPDKEKETLRRNQPHVKFRFKEGKTPEKGKRPDKKKSRKAAQKVELRGEKWRSGSISVKKELVTLQKKKNRGRANANPVLGWPTAGTPRELKKPK